MLITLDADPNFIYTIEDDMKELEECELVENAIEYNVIASFLMDIDDADTLYAHSPNSSDSNDFMRDFRTSSETSPPTLSQENLNATLSSFGSETIMKRSTKRKVRVCEIEGCARFVQRNRLCYRHGGQRRCQASGCIKKDRGHGYCVKHGGGMRCQIQSCQRAARKSQYCGKHDAINANWESKLYPK